MKLSELLAARPAILRHALLAHTAAAWATLHRLAERVAANQLHGRVRITRDNPAGQPAWPELTSLELKPSVLAEHFTEDDVFALAEALALATDREQLDLTFELDDLGADYAAPLLQTLTKAGIQPDLTNEPPSAANDRLRNAS
ncbi:MAG: hypothetical protein ABII82_18265 [Verrucomicrobiota bacterium]